MKKLVVYINIVSNKYLTAASLHKYVIWEIQFNVSTFTFRKESIHRGEPITCLNLLWR